ncbi:hypothetical protein BZL30_1488 [Mycobacterium kansasii]|uniref:Uncharacterized protein n=1 Tax=Mycobacterium kansasii TaxID=1768 RepID=A0A1V3XUW9_MYCKA|nr:hypothetical protein BZL30_1488 [Mycobacterium kansasii]
MVGCPPTRRYSVVLAVNPVRWLMGLHVVAPRQRPVGRPSLGG